VSVKTR